MNTFGSISNAEWQIMRVVWTLKKCTSSQVIKVMNSKVKWKASTVKTLLSRLKQKNFVSSSKIKRRNLYRPKIGEQRAADLAVTNLFHNICPMHAGSALNHLFQNITISQSNIKTLIKTLKRIEPTAPQHVKCNCLVNTKEVNCDEHEKHE